MSTLPSQHVVEDAHRVTVTVNDRTEYAGTVHGLDAVFDLAVVSICCGDFRTLPFSDDVNLPVGSEVVNVGYALGFDGAATVTRGIVSAVRYDQDKRAHFIQMDASMNPGNSGGPMLSLDGVVLGINSFTYGDGLGFAISGRDVLEVLPILKNTPPIAPMPTPTAVPLEQVLLFGPVDDSIDLENEDDYGAYSSGVWLRDVDIEVTFQNRMGTSESGVFFRSTGTSIYYVGVDWNAGVYRFNLWQDGRSWGEWVDVEAEAINTLPTGSNHIRVIASAGVGLLFINGLYVSSIDLGDRQGYGDIGLWSFRLEDSNVPETQFENFTVRRARALLHGPEDGEIKHTDDGFIDEHLASVQTEDGVIEATFWNPYATSVGPWSSGFIFRGDELRKQFHFVVITSDGYYLHDVRLASEADDRRLIEFHSSINTGAGEKNHILVSATGNTGALYINGQHIGNLDLGGLTGGGSVSAIASYFPGHGIAGYPTRFENFTVWP